MKKIVLSTLVMFGLSAGGMVFAEELKKSEIAKPTNLESQVIDQSKDAGNKSEAVKENSEPKRPFHFVGHSENG